MTLAFRIFTTLVLWLGMAQASSAQMEALGRLNAEVAHLSSQGRYAEAVAPAQHALALSESLLGKEHTDVARSLDVLASVLERQGIYADAEPLIKRAQSIYEAAFGSSHPEVAFAIERLAFLHDAQGRIDVAEQEYARALLILEMTWGPAHKDLQARVSRLGGMARRQGRFDDALRYYERALAIAQRSLGPEHPQVGAALQELGAFHELHGREAQAQAAYERALPIVEKAFGGKSVETNSLLNRVAAAAFARQDWDKAVDLLRRAVDDVVVRAKSGSNERGQAVRATAEQEMAHEQSAPDLLIKAAARLGKSDPSRERELRSITFTTAQWAMHSRAASAISDAAVRFGAREQPLIDLLRQRQEFVVAWDEIIYARPAPDTATTVNITDAAEARNHRIIDIENAIAEIDATLARDYPRHVAFASPQALTIEQVQEQLQDDEALVVFLVEPQLGPTPEETFIWAVTKTASRWVRSDRGATALLLDVAALRCGLDTSNWDEARLWPADTPEQTARKDAQLVRRANCKETTGVDWVLGQALPFDLVKASDLYGALFEEIEDLIGAKNLILVPSGPLTQLPFQTLVTAKPAASDLGQYARAHWLITRNALTVLPSVSSLAALRDHVTRSQAKIPFVGFGNPLLTGPAGTDRRAFAKSLCNSLTGFTAPVGATEQLSPSMETPFGLADVAILRRQDPLPETADELCSVAHFLGAEERQVYLADRATETMLKQLDLERDLATARIVHFATHGLTASETEGASAGLVQPALLLTPPEKASPEDDGLLTAAEVANLRLDADWVILSACNTAAGAQDDEALSGLARAFFYAGARAVLASHWIVDSDAAVELVTGAFAEQSREPNIGRAEAMRRVMRHLIAAGEEEAHPSYWAPFVVVGEGAKVH